MSQSACLSASGSNTVKRKKSNCHSNQQLWFLKPVKKTKQKFEICSSVKTKEVFELGTTHIFFTEEILCSAKKKKQKGAPERDAGNLPNSFDLSFNRPWQGFNKLPTKSCRDPTGMTDCKERKGLNNQMRDSRRHVRAAQFVP